MFFKSASQKLEDHRQETLISINEQKLGYDEMMQRADNAGEPPDEESVRPVLDRFASIEQRARAQDTTIDELDSLLIQAKHQNRFKASICPKAELADEGSFLIDEMEEWNLPTATIARLRTLHAKKIEVDDQTPGSARGALRLLYEEYESWATYTDDYEETMDRYTRWLFGAMGLALALAIVGIRYTPTLIPALLMGGIAGSCCSIMAKMPTLDVSLSGELEAYKRRILSRVGVGAAASLIGSAFLEWGILPISVQGKAFPDVFDACASTTPAACTNADNLILLGLLVLIGFSERALTSFERKIFGLS